MRWMLLTLAAAGLVLNGCTMVPQYARPPLPVPSVWPGGPARGAQVAGIDASNGWRETFPDPGMQAVINLALANNRDLRIAALNIEKARALYRIQRSELNPGVGVMAAGERYRLPERLGENGDARVVSQYSVNLGLASWEIDLFGRLRSLKARALDQYLATEQAHIATHVALVAEVARGYLTVAGDGELLTLARSTLETQQASWDLIRRSRELGVASDLELRQAESQVEAARAEVARAAGALAVDRSILDLVVGVPVSVDLMPDGWNGLAEVQGVAPGVSSEVLLRRPDILAAEHQLKAANANIGAARAAFFPRISLTAGFGTMSPDLSGLFGSGTRTWSFAPQIVAPLFASGSLRANLKVARVDREIAVATYEKAIQTAFAEVSSSLALRATLLDQKAAQAALVEALAETHRLSQARYRGGIDGYLSVLVAQRSLVQAQQALLGVRLAEQANLVTLYKVLGGGV